MQQLKNEEKILLSSQAALLFADMEKHVTLSMQDRIMITSRIRIREYGKKDFIFGAGVSVEEFFFVCSGIVCLYANDEKGNPHGLQFGIPGWWITDMDKFLSGMPTTYSMGCPEACTLIVLSKNDYGLLIKELPVFAEYFRIILEKKYAAAIRKIELLMCEPAENRFEKFSNAFPGFVQKVPQYVLASVLGFTPQFLSMLRGKIRR